MPLRCMLLISSLILFYRERQGLFFIFNSVFTKDTQFEGDITMAEGKEGQLFAITATPKSKSGKTAKIQDGSAEWFSGDLDVADVHLKSTLDANNNIIASENELQVVVELKAEGSTLVSLSADADPSEAVKTIIGTLPVVCLVGDAVVFDIQAGPPVDPPATT